MTTAYTSLLGLALPVQGELTGVWGDTVNNSITSLLDSAVAGTTNVSTDTDVTLTTTTGAANTARQAILLFSGARTALRTVTAPAQSKIYTVINATTGGFSVKLVGAGPTTGVTIIAGESAVCAWNGSDFIKISNTGGSASFVNLTASGTVTFTGLTASQAVFTNASDELVSNAITGTGNVVMSASPTLTGTISAAAATLSGNLTLSGGTANGVAYLNGSKVVTSGSALTFDGSNLVNGGNFSTGTSGLATYFRASGTAYTQIGDNQTLGAGTAFVIGSSTPYLAGNVGGSEGMRLTSTGLGIGTSSPAAKLHIGGNTASTQQAIFTTGVTDSDFKVVARNGVSGATAVQGYIGLDYANGTWPLLAGMQFIRNSTSGELAFTAGATTSASEQMRLTSTGLGIGTSAPAVKLDVIGGIKATIASTASNNIRVGNSGSNFYFATENSAGGSFCVGSLAYSGLLVSDNAIQLSTTNGGSVQATLTTSGNLGLGVTPSAWRSVDRVMQAGSGVSQFGHFVSGGVGAVYGGGFYRDDSGFKYTLTATPAGRFDFNYTTSGGFTWNIAPTGTAGNAITFTQAMTLDASGNLGVGTTSPIGIGGYQGITIGGTNGALIRLQSGASTQNAQIAANTSGLEIECINTGIPMKFYTGGSERARIDSSGNLLVGTTSTSNGALINWYKASGTIETSLGGITTAQNHIVFANPNGNVGSIQVDGSATSYNTSSDYRLKNTIAPMTGALAKVALLKPCTYKWNADGSDGEGFIAHELAEVVPQCVTGEKDAVDEDGNPKYQGIDTSFLVATLTAAIQEQQAIIESLKARLDAANL